MKKGNKPNIPTRITNMQDAALIAQQTGFRTAQELEGANVEASVATQVITGMQAAQEAAQKAASAGKENRRPSPRREISSRAEKAGLRMKTTNTIDPPKSTPKVQSSAKSQANGRY